MGKKKSKKIQEEVEEQQPNCASNSEENCEHHNTETIENTEDGSESKRKNPFATEEKPPKRIKKKRSAEEQQPVVEEENENVLPTAPLSKRQKKKQKKLLNMTKSKDKEVEKTNAYLDKWNSNRDEWKYEKLRQIFLQKHILDVNVIDDEHCDIAIKYLSTSKGHARKILLDSAELFIKSIDDKLTDENREELINSPGYKRAREMMQSMQD